MKKRLISLCFVAVLVVSFSIPALAADYGFSRYLGSGNSGYLRYCDQTGSSSSSTSWYKYSPSSSLKVKISSNGGGGTVYVNIATYDGNYIASRTINGTGTASFSRSGSTAVQLDNLGGSGTIKGTVTTS